MAAHLNFLPHSVPSPELRASPAPSPSSAVTKKSNSFKASSVSGSSVRSAARPSFPIYKSNVPELSLCTLWFNGHLSHFPTKTTSLSIYNMQINFTNLK